MDTSGRAAGSPAQSVDFGPLTSLMQDEGVSEIHVDDYQTIYVARGNKVERVSMSFRDDTHLIQVIQDLVRATGYSVGRNQPVADFSLADGSRINVVVPPVALKGPCLTIRKAVRSPITIEKLVETGSITSEAAEFLRAAVISKVNILICGNVSTGKTTLLNTLATWCSGDERILIIEKTPELRLYSRTPWRSRLLRRPLKEEPL